MRNLRTRVEKLETAAHAGVQCICLEPGEDLERALLRLGIERQSGVVYLGADKNDQRI